MFVASALRLPRPPPFLTSLITRTNATVAATHSQPSALPTLPVSKGEPKTSSAGQAAATFSEQESNQTQGRRRRRKLPPQRPNISLESPRKWNRPIAEGALPAYDLALQLIQNDSNRLKQEAGALQARIDAVEEEYQAMIKARDAGKGIEEGVLEAKNQEIEQMRIKLNVLDVQSEVNLPSTRWRVANAMVDMTKPVHRHLLEQRWRKEGDLDLLMERIHQMHVVPDILPEFHPSIDLRLTATALPQEILLKSKLDKAVEPGTFLLPQQTVKPPKLYPNVFHTDTRLYTMLLVDPDVPDEENATFTTFLHWMKPNIPLSATHRGRISDLNDHTTYIPPHPQQGTPYHRYVLLLLLQPPVFGTSCYSLNAAARTPPNGVTSRHLDIPIVSNSDRLGFNVRSFMEQWGLDGSKGGGAHMFREIWNQEVSKIYAEILKKDEPRYGRPRKPDPYAMLKETRRYS
ncbi:hypothetical protein AMATHDRAFT_60524, partial [Amanita thiersii Skay4041]